MRISMKKAAINKTQVFTIPAGYGGNMDYSHISKGECVISDRLILVITFADKYELKGYLQYSGIPIKLNILHFMLCLDKSGILNNRGTYFTK